MINRFHDHWQPPMPGGWHFSIDGEMRRGGSAEECFAMVKAELSNNGKHPGDAALEKQLWDYWCSLDPARCGMKAVQDPVPAASREILKDEWGPRLWHHLNHAAVHFDKEYFIALCAGLTRKLIPCPECRGHWSTLMNEIPPWAIGSKMEACDWVFSVHNRVNERLGKRTYTWARAVAEFGFPTK